MTDRTATLDLRADGVNAVFHDPAAALVIDGVAVAAAEEERFSRRKHGKAPVAFSTWELPEASMAWCLRSAGVEPAELDAVAYSYDPDLAPPPNGEVTAGDWEALRTLYVRRAPLFLKTALPGLDPGRVRFVAHHAGHTERQTQLLRATMIFRFERGPGRSCTGTRTRWSICSSQPPRRQPTTPGSGRPG